MTRQLHGDLGYVLLSPAGGFLLCAMGAFLALQLFRSRFSGSLGKQGHQSITLPAKSRAGCLGMEWDASEGGGCFEIEVGWPSARDSLGVIPAFPWVRLYYL